MRSISEMGVFSIIGYTCLIFGELIFINEGIPRIFGAQENLLELWKKRSHTLGEDACKVFTTSTSNS